MIVLPIRHLGKIVRYKTSKSLPTLRLLQLKTLRFTEITHLKNLLAGTTWSIDKCVKWLKLSSSRQAEKYSKFWKNLSSIQKIKDECIWAWKWTEKNQIKYILYIFTFEFVLHLQNFQPILICTRSWIFQLISRLSSIHWLIFKFTQISI